MSPVTRSVIGQQGVTIIQLASFIRYSGPTTLSLVCIGRTPLFWQGQWLVSRTLLLAHQRLTDDAIAYSSSTYVMKRLNSSYFSKSTEAKHLARQGIEQILSPKQMRRPLPFLLILSFFYGVQGQRLWVWFGWRGVYPGPDPGPPGGRSAGGRHHLDQQLQHHSTRAALWRI